MAYVGDDEELQKQSDLQKQMREWPQQKDRDDDLSFGALRAANIMREPMFVNAKGERQHRPGEPLWSLNDWMTAVTGELGEAANVLKKIRRGDFTLAEVRPKLRQEFADVVIYLDILAREAGIDLGHAVLVTFNAKSDQLELPLFLTPDGPMTQRPADIRK